MNLSFLKMALETMCDETHFNPNGKWKAILFEKNGLGAIKEKINISEILKSSHINPS